ncbi:MAG TPA: hypothetical protein VGQ24_09800 [Gemmatimonadales bacterium]|nr:hypothetical protein [Gemmatimonadales bacterium]
MAWSLTVNGTDPAAAGFFFTFGSDGVFDAVNRTAQLLNVSGRAGTIFGNPVQEGVRLIQIRGLLTSTAKTAAAREIAEDKFKDMMRAGLVRLVRTSSSNVPRCIEGFTTGPIKITPVGNLLDATDSQAELTLTCQDSYWRDIEPTLRGCPAAATRYTLPLGTAPSTALIRNVGAANTPVITYRDAGGAIIWQLTIGHNLAATNDWFDSDMRSGKFTKWASGVTSNGIGGLSGSFPVVFDPQDGDYVTSQWPTIETSLGTLDVLYWKQWQ